MKVCLVNVNNCINYSQYGPFFFEHIRNKDLSVYSVSDTSQLHTIHDKIVAEVNRNAFKTDEISLIFAISRNMTSIEINEYDFYNKINIYQHICSKLPVSIRVKVAIIYMDTLNSTGFGASHEFDENLGKSYITEDEKFKDYLLIGKDFKTKKDLADAAAKISNSTFRSFFESVISSIDDMVDAKLNATSLVNYFAGQCTEKLPEIERIYEVIPPASIEESIKKNLKTVYFIKALATEQVALHGYEDFEIDYEKIKAEIATYINRLSAWLDEKVDIIGKIEAYLEEYIGSIGTQELDRAISEIIHKHLRKINIRAARNSDLAEQILVALEEIVKNADDEMKKFAQKCVTEYFDDEKYQLSNEDLSKYDNPIDKKKREAEILDMLNTEHHFNMPTYEERLALEQKLDNAEEKADKLFVCQNAYSLPLFGGTLLFAIVGVAVLYLIAQFSVFVKENSFAIYGAYCGVLAILFALVYVFKLRSNKRRINKILKECKRDVELYLAKCSAIAHFFEENIKTMATYYCFNKFMGCDDICECSNNDKMKKYAWHVRKVREILTNFNHFNDFVGETRPVEEEKNITLKEFDHDAEHTEFYQLKIF